VSTIIYVWDYITSILLMCRLLTVTKLMFLASTLDREVKKANRDLASLLSTVDSPLSRFDAVQKRYTELLSDMKRLERDYQKSKKRADQLQKEKDGGKSELNKTLSIKDKLEKLCRELQKENKKVKVGASSGGWSCSIKEGYPLTEFGSIRRSKSDSKRLKRSRG
jgi:septal ring factor EnvC (AmiA/AmiB activator)